MDDLFGLEELLPLEWSSAPVCVCMCVCVRASVFVCIGWAGHFTELFELWRCVGGRESRPVTSPPCLLSLSPSFSGDHICFFSVIFFPSFSSLWLSFLTPKKCLSQQKPEAVRRRKAALAPHRGPLSLYTGPPAKTHLCPFLCFWGINLLLWQARLWWTC